MTRPDLALVEQRVIARFHRSIEAKMAIGESIAPALAEAATVIANGLVSGGKVFVVGSGRAAPLAAIFTATLVAGSALERPSLPALTLTGDASDQLRALANPADILVAICSDGNASALQALIASAHTHSMGVVALTTGGDDNADPLAATDVELRIADDDLALTQEIQLLMLCCLGELIEQQLFGGHDRW